MLPQEYDSFSMFLAQIVTLFPDMFPGPLAHSLLGRAMERGIWALQAHQLRDAATDKHRTVDDTPYGGGAGMLLKPDVVAAAVRAAIERQPQARRIYLSPRGRVLDQPLAAELADAPGLILVCGRYEGLDERAIEALELEEISIGDVVLTGGEIAAMTLLDATVRLLPGVLGADLSAEEESFGFHEDYACLLEYPHYTKPPIWEGMPVPEALLSGHHEQIRRWQLAEAERITRERRPDLWTRYQERQQLRRDDALRAKKEAKP